MDSRDDSAEALEADRPHHGKRLAQGEDLNDQAAGLAGHGGEDHAGVGACGDACVLGMETVRSEGEQGASERVMRHHEPGAAPGGEGCTGGAQAGTRRGIVAESDGRAAAHGVGIGRLDAMGSEGSEESLGGAGHQDTSQRPGAARSH